MTVKLPKNDPWYDENFQPNAGPAPSDDFATVDGRGLGLRPFLQGETRAQAASSGTNETLVPGKLYLRQQPSGLRELIPNRGPTIFSAVIGNGTPHLSV